MPPIHSFYSSRICALYMMSVLVCFYISPVSFKFYYVRAQSVNQFTKNFKTLNLTRMIVRHCTFVSIEFNIEKI